MTQAKVTANRPDAANEGLINILTSISVVSMRLARKVKMLAITKTSQIYQRISHNIPAEIKQLACAVWH